MLKTQICSYRGYTTTESNFYRVNALGVCFILSDGSLFVLFFDSRNAGAPLGAEAFSIMKAYPIVRPTTMLGKVPCVQAARGPSPAAASRPCSRSFTLSTLCARFV